MAEDIGGSGHNNEQRGETVGRGEERMRLDDRQQQKCCKKPDDHVALQTVGPVNPEMKNGLEEQGAERTSP